MRTVIEFLNDSLRNKLKSLNSKDVFEKIYSIQTTLILSLATTEPNVERLWEDLTAASIHDDDVVDGMRDFLLNLMPWIRVNCDLDKIAYENLIHNLSEILVVGTQVDEEIVERTLQTPKAIVELLQEAPWFVGVLLIALSENIEE